MLAARLFVGVGEAAYGSVGIAVVLAVFPVHMRSTLASSFLAGTVIGQVMGVAIGGQVAATHGWRTAFELIGYFGLALALLYPLVVREGRINRGPASEKVDFRSLLRLLFGKRVLWLSFFGSGIQLFCTGALAVWLPSLLNRYYAMPVDRAGKTTALFLLVCAVGMVSCGAISDRLAKNNPGVKPALASGFALGSAVLFGAALLGWIVGEVIVTDPVVEGWTVEQADGSDATTSA